jgi:hypothetical protein
MNQKLIIFFLLIALTATVSFRKYKQRTTQVEPSPGKKWIVTSIACDGSPCFATDRSAVAELHTSIQKLNHNKPKL